MEYVGFGLFALVLLGVTWWTTQIMSSIKHHEGGRHGTGSMTDNI